MCFSKKPVYDMCCNTHVACPIPNCNGCKGQVYDMNSTDKKRSMFIRQEFCPKRELLASVSPHLCLPSANG